MITTRAVLVNVGGHKTASNVRRWAVNLRSDFKRMRCMMHPCRTRIRAPFRAYLGILQNNRRPIEVSATRSARGEDVRELTCCKCINCNRERRPHSMDSKWLHNCSIDRSVCRIYRLLCQGLLGLITYGLYNSGKNCPGMRNIEVLGLGLRLGESVPQSCRTVTLHGEV